MSLPGLQKLPTTTEVHSLATSLQERGPQRLNAEQRLAVASVLLGAGGPTPFALWGPPGTGKPGRGVVAGTGHRLE